MTNPIAERPRKYMAVMDYGEADWQSDAMHQNKLLHDALTRAEVAEAKLAKAIAALDEALYFLDPDEEDIAKGAGLYRIVTTHKELKEN
jgi:hypothetical protein